MDWSKATNILIIALLIICLILGGILLAQDYSDKQYDKQAAVAAKEYLNAQGISLNCDIPMTRPYLSVLFVRFVSRASSDGQKELKEYKNIPVVFDYPGNMYYPEKVSRGEASAKVITASSALLEAALEAENDIKRINEIRLVYYIGSDSFNPESEDTAIPCWLIGTDKGNYYINAYEQ